MPVTKKTAKKLKCHAKQKTKRLPPRIYNRKCTHVNDELNHKAQTTNIRRDFFKSMLGYKQ